MWTLECLVCHDVGDDLVAMQRHIATIHYAMDPSAFWQHDTVRRIPSFKEDPENSRTLYEWEWDGMKVMKAERQKDPATP